MVALQPPPLVQPPYRPVARKPNRGPVEEISKSTQPVPDNKFTASNAHMVMWRSSLKKNNNKRAVDVNSFSHKKETGSEGWGTVLNHHIMENRES